MGINTNMYMYASSTHIGIVPGNSVDFAHSIGIKYSYGVELRDLGEFHFCLPENQIVATAEEHFAGLVTIVKQAYGYKHRTVTSCTTTAKTKVIYLLLIFAFNWYALPT